MFPPNPTTPFKNSPSIDALSPRDSNLNQSMNHKPFIIGEQKDTQPDGERVAVQGGTSISSDVPISLPRSVIPSSHLSSHSLSVQSHISSGSDKPQSGLANHWNTPTVAYSPAQVFPPIKHLPGHAKKRILVTGGAGFVGSHLVRVQ